ncbi:hypothetical protein V8E54_002022 [Elaphomyces granulatus]
MSPSQIQLRHVEREWIVKRTGKRRIVDRDICCAYVDEKTGTKCDWKTTDSVTKGNMTTQQRLEKNILRWVVTSKQPFTVVQDPDFKQIFLSLATHDRSVARCNSLPILAWLTMEFEYRQQVIEFTILAIIGLWLTTEFENWQQVIEFIELQGPHSGENLAATVDPGIGPCSQATESPLLEPMPAIAKPCFLICTADFLH